MKKGIQNGIRAMETDCHVRREYCEMWRMHSCFLISTFFSAVRHVSSADVGYSWKSYLKSTMGKSSVHGLAQMSIIMIFRLTESRGWGQKEAASEIHTLTNLRLSADWFSLCMPTIIPYNGWMEYGWRVVFFTVGLYVIRRYIDPSLASEQNSLVSST